MTLRPDQRSPDNIQGYMMSDKSQTLIVSPPDEAVATKASADLKKICTKLRSTGFRTFEPLAPFFLHLNGKPYHLLNHYPFSPFFRSRIPQKMLLKSGRQCGKSQSLAARGVLLAQLVPYFKQLYITPLFEMIRRFSSNYVAPLIDGSPFRNLLLGSAVQNSVLQRSFRNGSSMMFSFAYMDANRARGIPTDAISYDEIQDMNIEFLPIINETASASLAYGIIQYAGTPKSVDNTMEKLWTDTSMAEWVIRCRTGGCNHFNIPSLDCDLRAMMGPWHSDISEKTPALICAKCRKPLSPYPVSKGGAGRWVHRYREKRWEFSGLHIPQQIMPMHFANQRKWKDLLNKAEGRGNVPINVFYNEVCGESWDAGAKLVTLSDLRRAANLEWGNTLEEATSQRNRSYIKKICAVDWGGGGVSRGKSDFKLQSYTTVAVCGLTFDGKIEVLYGYRSHTPYDHVREARLVIEIASRFNCDFVAHDYTGAGSTRETLLVQAGVPQARLLPVIYTGGLKGSLVQYKPPTENMPRSHYIVDRNRSLSFTCQFIKSLVIRFFREDYQNSENPGVLRDFLSLIEDKSDSPTGRGGYKILRDPAGPDDFAHSVNIGTMMLYHIQQQWPDLTKYEDITVTDDYLWELRDITLEDWND
jgi:hypothetical protein